jgi:hypothetical protein
MKINSTTPATIENYAAGTKGNLFVFEAEGLQSTAGFNTKKGEQHVRILICTAKVSDPEVQKALAAKCDNVTRSDRIIVVSQDFKKLSKKSQQILLFRENAKNAYADNPKNECDLDPIVKSEVETVAAFGSMFGSQKVRRAFKKELNYRQKDEFKIGRAAQVYRKKQNANADAKQEAVKQAQQGVAEASA